jgi:hypothetical protein
MNVDEPLMGERPPLTPEDVGRFQRRSRHDRDGGHIKPCRMCDDLGDRGVCTCCGDLHTVTITNPDTADAAARAGLPWMPEWDERWDEPWEDRA